MPDIAANLGTALVIGLGLVVLFIIIRVVLKITHMLFTLGCLALIVIAVLVLIFTGAGSALLGIR